MNKFEPHITQEPEQVKAYLDVNGQYHANRDEALEANFMADFNRAVFNLCCSVPEYQSLPLRHIGALVREFIEENPALVRVLLEDYDLTGLLLKSANT